MFLYINLDLNLSVVKCHGKILIKKMTCYTFHFEKYSFALNNRLKKGKND